MNETTCTAKEVGEEIDAALKENDATMDQKVKETAAAEIAAAIGQTPAPEKEIAVLHDEKVAPEPKKPVVPNALFVFPNSKRVKDLLTYLAILLDEVTVEAYKDGLHIRGMDPSRVAMFNVYLPKHTFTEYDVKTTMEPSKDPRASPAIVEIPVKFCFSIETALTKVFKNVYSTSQYPEVCGLTVDHETEKLRFRLISDITRNFSIPTLEASEEDVPLPKISFDVNAKLVVKPLVKLFKEDASDHVRVDVDSTGIKFSETGDISDYFVKLEKGCDSLLDLMIRTAEAHATYSTSYLKPILEKAVPLAELCTIEFSTDMPMQLSLVTYNADERLEFFLAPRIETE